MAALLYDAFLVAAVWMSLGFVLQMIFGTDTSQLEDGRVVVDPLYRALVFLMMVSSAATFYIWFWRRTGQTLGMIAWRIKVLSLNNCHLSLKQGLIRFFAAWPAFWIGGLGYLWMYIDKDGDALHEKISRSKTVLLPKGSRPF
jgi:uncharacterized RDD family membrane protein YckC